MKISLTLVLEIEDVEYKCLELMFSGKHRWREREEELVYAGWLDTDQGDSLVDAYILPVEGKGG